MKIANAYKRNPLDIVKSGHKINMSKEVYETIMYFVDKSPIECSGLGRCSFKDGIWTVHEVYVPKQENTATSTDLDATEVAKLECAVMKDEGNLNFWWHSHVNMAAFWSGTDTDTIEELGRAGYCLATVFNKKGECKSAYYQGGDDFIPNIFINDIPLEITGGKVVRPDLDKIYEEKCTKKVYATQGKHLANNWNKRGKKTIGKQTKTTILGGETRTGKGDLEMLCDKTVSRVLYQYEQTDQIQPWGDFWGTKTTIVYSDDTKFLLGIFESRLEAKEAYQIHKQEIFVTKTNKDSTEKTTDSLEIGEVASGSSFQSRGHGTIHHQSHDLRWDSTADTWLSYAVFFNRFVDLYFDNILDDVIGKRETMIEMMYAQGVIPKYDKHVNRHYIAHNTREITFDTFYK